MKTETMIHVGVRTLLSVDEIYLLKAELNYTKFLLNDGTNVLYSTNLGKKEDLSTNHFFVRTNRSTILSWDSIHAIEIQHSRVILKNKEVFSISRKRKKMFSKLQYTQ